LFNITFTTLSPKETNAEFVTGEISICHGMNADGPGGRGGDGSGAYGTAGAAGGGPPGQTPGQGQSTTNASGGFPQGSGGRGQGGVGNAAGTGRSGTFSPPRSFSPPGTAGAESAVLAGNRSSDTSQYSSDPGLLMSPGRDQVALQSPSAIRLPNTAMGYR